jgi:hypothetical protein
MNAHYWRGSLTIWLLVISHWVLDLVTHGPDLPLYAGGPKYGLELWNHPRATIAVEMAMYLVGMWIYWSTTRAKDRIGEWACWAFVIVLMLFYAYNIVAPPPPNVKTLAIAAILLAWLLVIWAWWFDRHRTTTES